MTQLIYLPAIFLHKDVKHKVKALLMELQIKISSLCSFDYDTLLNIIRSLDLI